MLFISNLDNIDEDLDFVFRKNSTCISEAQVNLTLLLCRPPVWKYLMCKERNDTFKVSINYKINPPRIIDILPSTGGESSLILCEIVTSIGFHLPDVPLVDLLLYATGIL